MATIDRACHSSRVETKSTDSRLFVLVALASIVALGVGGRLLPHPPNVTPLAAAALFSGFIFRRWSTATAAPLVTLFVSDLILGFYDWRLMTVVYASFLAPILLRPIIRRKPTVLRAAGCSLAASVLFYATSNLGVWVLSGLYERTWAGLLECYVAAIPFFRNSVLGDFAWAVIFFGGYSVAARGIPLSQLRERLAPGTLIPQPLA